MSKEEKDLGDENPLQARDEGKPPFPRGSRPTVENKIGPRGTKTGPCFEKEVGRR